MAWTGLDAPPTDPQAVRTSHENGVSHAHACWPLCFLPLCAHARLVRRPGQRQQPPSRGAVTSNQCEAPRLFLARHFSRSSSKTTPQQLVTAFLVVTLATIGTQLCCAMLCNLMLAVALKARKRGGERESSLKHSLRRLQERIEHKTFDRVSRPLGTGAIADDCGRPTCAVSVPLSADRRASPSSAAE